MAEEDREREEKSPGKPRDYTAHDCLECGKPKNKRMSHCHSPTCPWCKKCGNRVRSADDEK